MSNTPQPAHPAPPPVTGSPAMARQLDQIPSVLGPVIEDLLKASAILRRHAPALRALLRGIAGPHPPGGSLIRALLREAEALAAVDETEMALSGPLFWARQVLRQYEQGQPAAILRPHWGAEPWDPSPRARALLDHAYDMMHADRQTARLAREKREARKTCPLTLVKTAPAGNEE